METSRSSLTLAGFLITFTGAVLFSTKAILVKLAFAHTKVDAVTLLALRMAFALPFYLLAAYWSGRRENAAPLNRRQWWLVIATGLTGYYLSSLFDFLGLQYISAGLERLILFLYPTFALLLNKVLFRQAILRKQVAAVLLTYLGIGLAFWGELRVDVTDKGFFLGSGLVFLCALTYSFYIVGSGRLIPQVGVTRFTAYAMLAATAGVFVHYAVAAGMPPEGSGSLFGYGFLLALVATVIPSFLLSDGLRRIGSNNVAVISSIGPVSTILQAHFFLGEAMGWLQLAGTALVVAGVLLLGWKSVD